MVLILINVYQQNTTFNFVDEFGSITIFGLACIGTFAFSFALVLAALVLHAIDKKSREAVITRRLLKRAKNAVHAYKHATHVIKQLEKFIYSLEYTIEHKKAKIKRLHNQLHQNYIRTNVALKLQSRINSLERQIKSEENKIVAMKLHIKKLNERPTLAEKLAYRKNLKLQKEHERKTREELRKKYKAQKARARALANLRKDHPIYIPHEQPKNLTPEQRDQ